MKLLFALTGLRSCFLAKLTFTFGSKSQVRVNSQVLFESLDTWRERKRKNPLGGEERVKRVALETTAERKNLSFLQIHSFTVCGGDLCRKVSALARNVTGHQ